MNLPEREKDFKEAVLKQSYSRDILEQFFDYWSEPNKSGTKMKWELEKTWEIGRRLKTWERNNQKWNKNGTHQQSINHSPKTRGAYELLEKARAIAGGKTNT